ncbi:MAG: sulfatase-like hydrolase/transferase [Bryobacteraceae bacterium]|nr:sulfatase-like hydrolase/transferase [Bryobacteraceae bacterium]
MILRRGSGLRHCPFILALLLLGSCGTKSEDAAGGHPGKLRPVNLLVVTIDTMRADRLGCYGYAKAETPVLDALARGGTLFENAAAETPLTPPSHASMFTGMNPNVHGVRNVGGFVLQSSSVTLAEIVQEQGWDTAAFIGASVLKKLFGFSQGFALYDDQMPKPGLSQMTREYPERPAEEVVNRAIGWLNSQSGKPFFLWVHVFDPHLPYEPPAPFDKKFEDPYDGEIAYVDRELGRLFAEVEKKAPGNTVIAVLSDHGESLGEHGEYTHGVFLYDATLRIAFMLAGPGVPAGVRVKQQARTIDLLPTLMDLMGGTAPADVQGTSLTPAFSGKEVPTTYAYAETLFPKMNMGWSELRAVRTTKWKYIQAPKPELYDLEQDPHERNNVIATNAAEAQELKQQLQSLIAVHGSGTSEKVQTSLLDQKTMSQLKTLGYLSGFSSREYELTGQGIDPKDRVGILNTVQVAVSADSKIPRPKRAQLLREALQQDPTNPSLYYHLGGELEKMGQFREAMALYKTGLEKGIRSGRLHSRIADLYLREGNKTEAIASYEKAAQLNPADVESQSNLATAYLESGRVPDAERAFKWILATGEEYPAAYNGLGLIAIGKRDVPAARENFEKAVRLDPDLVEAQLNLGLIYKMMGANDQARKCFEAFIAKAPPRQYAQIIPQVKQELELLR